jgi:hypothetical protein
MDVSLNEFIEFIRENADYQNPTVYHVTEEFPVNGVREYDLINFQLEECEGFVLGYDSEKYLRDNLTLVIGFFLAECLTKIEIEDNMITLLFVDGTVKIKY